MPTGISAVVQDMRVIARELVPGDVPLPAAIGLWRELDLLERLAAAGKVLLAARVAESKVWREAGHRGAAEHLAAVAGTSVGAAQSLLETSGQLAQLDHVAQAVREGRLSGPQTTCIADAAADDPSAQEQLVARAAFASLRELRDECRRVKAKADPDPDARNRRHHTNRRLRTYLDTDGAWRLAARGTVETGARLMAALNPIIDRLFTEPRREGRREPREAYAYDALIELAGQHAGSGRMRPSHLALVRVDLEALVRGRVEGEELCEITGLGPIPVSVARRILGDSVLKLVITKGVDVAHLTHLGRGPTAAQRLALLWSSPTCAVAGCNGVRYQHDHRIPYATTKHTRLDELDPLCPRHHERKTRENWELVVGKGKRAFVPPTDPRHPRYRTTEPVRPPPRR